MPGPKTPARTFQDLVVWRKAHELVLAVSVPANIAEGFRRRGKADKARYMNMAEASLEESPRSVGNEGRLVALRTERLFSAHGY